MKSLSYKIETIENPSYKILENEKCYGRNAVIYEHEKGGVMNSEGTRWVTRPEPMKPSDIPDPENRCVYRNEEKEEYGFDTTGKIVKLFVKSQLKG